MRLEDLHGDRSREKATSRAILAVEQQAERRRLSSSPERKRQQQMLFDLLDSLSEAIFAGIAKAAAADRPRYEPGNLPEFREGCERIFGFGFGVFDPQLFNEWLYARDLSHLFRAEQGAVVW